MILKKNFILEKTRKTIDKLVEMIHRHLGLIKKETAGQILYYFLQDTGLLQKMTDYKNVVEERRAQNISKFFDNLFDTQLFAFSLIPWRESGDNSC